MYQTTLDSYNADGLIDGIEEKQPSDRLVIEILFR
jgi:hypothetical protein